MIFWGYFGNILGIFWGYFGDILGIFWGYFGDILRIFWGYLWDIFKISLSERTSGVPPVIFKEVFQKAGQKLPLIVEGIKNLFLTIVRKSFQAKLMLFSQKIFQKVASKWSPSGSQLILLSPNNIQILSGQKILQKRGRQ